MVDRRRMHDYSGSGGRGSAPGKSATISVPLKEGSRQVSAETKELTVPLVAAAADMRFDAWNPPYQAWEIKTVKSKYAPGEIVYAQICVKNVGGTTGKATITVRDLDTNNVEATITTPDIKPNWRWKTSVSHARIGAMPTHEWRLEFHVKP